MRELSVHLYRNNAFSEMHQPAAHDQKTKNHTCCRYFNRLFFPTPLQRVRKAITEADYVTSEPTLSRSLFVHACFFVHLEGYMPVT